mmetsp:Transcript_55320/g.125794  ORF Transcript_55320/g.125794 Transcript_55320/m.125794 type:complete len:329 (+) Transcript_55320:907-1893(+)
MFSLFKVFTLESWPSVYEAAVLATPDSGKGYVWIFFAAFISIGSIILMNLMTGVILENVLTVAKDAEAERVAMIEKSTLSQAQTLGTLFQVMDDDSNGYVTIDELRAALDDPTFANKLEEAGVLAAVNDVSKKQLLDLFALANVDDAEGIPIETMIAMMMRCSHKIVTQQGLFEAVCLLRRELIYQSRGALATIVRAKEERHHSELAQADPVSRRLKEAVMELTQEVNQIKGEMKATNGKVDAVYSFLVSGQNRPNGSRHVVHEIADGPAKLKKATNSRSDWERLQRPAWDVTCCTPSGQCDPGAGDTITAEVAQTCSLGGASLAMPR